MLVGLAVAFDGIAFGEPVLLYDIVGHLSYAPVAVQFICVEDCDKQSVSVIEDLVNNLPGT